jgi:hypothetical protein
MGEGTFRSKAELLYSETDASPRQNPGYETLINMTFIDRPGFEIEILKDDWRLTPSAAKRRATGSDKVKPCKKCGKRRVEFSQAIRWKEKAYCSECRRKYRDSKKK